MRSAILSLVLIVFFILLAEGHKGHYHGYRRYGGYRGDRHQNHVQIPNVKNPVPPVNICPQIMCPEFIPQNCRKESYINEYGVMCRVCDVNICTNKNADVKPIDPVKQDVKPERGDIPKIPKFLDQINGQIASTLTNPLSNTGQIFFPNSPIQNSNPILLQNSLPVTGQFNVQNNLPVQPQWHDNALVNTNWQGNQWQGVVPTNNQWQSPMNLNSNIQNTIPVVNSPLLNTNPNVVFPLNNNLPQVSTGFSMPMISVTGNLVSQRTATEPWESGPFQPAVVNNLNNLPSIPNIASIPQDSSLPIFKNGQSIGSPITGLPMQITGKSLDALPVRVESDRGLGPADSLYSELSSTSNLNSKVYQANSPDNYNGIGPIIAV